MIIIITVFTLGFVRMVRSRSSSNKLLLMLRAIFSKRNDPCYFRIYSPFQFSAAVFQGREGEGVNKVVYRTLRPIYLSKISHI